MFRKNAWFFWVDRLHISVSERYFVAGLLLLYLVLSLAEPLIKRGNPYDDEYYRPLMHAFYERMEERYLEDLLVLEQYYPDMPDTVVYLASLRLPEAYRDVVRTEARGRSDVRGSPGSHGIDTAGGPPEDYDNVVSDSLRMQPPVNQSLESEVVSVSNAADSIRVNINTADIEELTRLPGIGPSIARRIIEFREENGPFSRPEDIMNVRGIGPSRFEQIGGMIEI